MPHHRLPAAATCILQPTDRPDRPPHRFPRWQRQRHRPKNLPLLNLAIISMNGSSLVDTRPRTTGIADSLSLSYDSIGEAGARSLAFALSLARQTKLTSLSLYCNRLKPEGAAALAPSLALMARLTSLKLTGNEVGAAWEAWAISLPPRPAHPY